MTTATQTTGIQQAIEKLAACKVIPLVRTDSAESALWAAEILLDGGFQCVEITYTTPDASKIIEALSQKYPDALLIAGTVLDQKTLVEALAAGAHALVSPVCDEQLIQFANQNDVLLLPGTLTPNEIARAVQHGASVVKVFPISPVGGADYIKAIRGPLPNVLMVPTGGVREKNFVEYLEAGCLAVGVNLISADILADRDEEALNKRVQKCMKRLDKFMGSDCDDSDFDADADDKEHDKEEE